MKVCFLAGTLGRGGAERQLIYMLRALKEAGVETKLLCLTTGEAFEPEIRELGVDIEWVGSRSGRISRLIKIVRAIEAYGPDIVQSAHFYTNIYVALAGRILGIPNIGAIRSDLISEIDADSVFGKWQFRLPGALIANSDLARARAVAMDQRGRRIELVRNAVELPNEPAENSRTGKTPIRLLFAGRLVRLKRPELFVKLAERLVRDLPGIDLSFEIVGDGPIRAELEIMREALGTSAANVHFHGELADLTEMYSRSDILVLTSSFEGTPNVVLEAMAHGLAVVASRVGGVPEILDEESGIVVHPPNLDGFFDGIKALILDPRRRKKMGVNGRARVSSKHSLGYLRLRLPEIYRNLRVGNTDD